MLYCVIGGLIRASKLKSGVRWHIPKNKISLYPKLYKMIACRPIPYKMKLEANSQISKHELKSVSIGSYISKVPENGGYYASILSFHFFLRHRMREFVLEKQIVTPVTRKCDTHDNTVLELLLLSCTFSNNW